MAQAQVQIIPFKAERSYARLLDFFPPSVSRRPTRNRSSHVCRVRVSVLAGDIGKLE